MPTPLEETKTVLSNAEIAERLMSLAQLLATKEENPFKLRAYRRAAETIASLPESVDELVRRDADLTSLSGIGKGISSAVREIVLEGSLRQLEALRREVGPELAALSKYPRLDPKRVQRIYRQLQISTVEELRQKLADGEIARHFGLRMEQHVRQALTEAREILLYDADDVVARLKKFLHKNGAKRAEATGDFRRRTEVIGEISFLVETDDFTTLAKKVEYYAGRTELLSGSENLALLKLSSGILLRVQTARAAKWGLGLLLATGAEEHLAALAKVGFAATKLTSSRESLRTEAAVYAKFDLAFIEPELREGRDEVALAAAKKLPALVSLADIRGELHAHSTSSDGAQSIEEMANAARERGYEYLGITDHSQSLKIAHGVSPADLRKQIRAIDRLNERFRGFRLLKSAEVDILADGALDYPNELLRELDYTVCSIHSRFRLGQAEQTERLLRAMDNPHFTILGHATGRLLLRRPGYEIDLDRVIEHARQRGCFFEINSSPDRLDLTAEHARLARDAGVKIAINTDAHSVGELDFIRCGLDQARRAGLEKSDVLNCLRWPELERLFSGRVK